MGTLFGIVAPVFALIAMGAAAPRLRLLDAGAVKGMSDFVFYLAMPSLLFRSMVTAPPLRLLDVAGSFILGAFLLFALAALLARFAWRARHAVLFALDVVAGRCHAQRCAFAQQRRFRVAPPIALCATRKR